MSTNIDSNLTHLLAEHFYGSKSIEDQMKGALAINPLQNPDIEDLIKLIDSVRIAKLAQPLAAADQPATLEAS